jgi:hypothetical protein
VGGLGGAVDGGAATSGVWFIPFGVTDGVQLTSTPVRDVEIANGQLYGDGDSTGAPLEIFTVGTGLPTSGAQTTTVLPATGSLDTSAWSYAFVPSSSTVYVASSMVVGSTLMGIQKWTFNGSNWTNATTFQLAPPLSAVGFRGLAAVATGSTVTLVASTVDTGSANNRLALFVDNGVYGTGGTTATGTIIATSATNSLYRGVAWSPR